jgi:hypothetical protein
MSSSSSYGSFVFALDADSGWLEWRSPPLFSPNSWFVRAGVGQLDLDGPLEIFASSFSLYHQLSTTVLLEGTSGAAGPERPAIGLAAQTLFDLDGDGEDEILVVSIDGIVGVLDPISGTFASTIGTYPGSIRALAVGDILGDDSLEVVLAFADRVQVVDAVLGVVLWTSPVVGDIQRETLRTADLDEFGHEEIVVNTSTGILAYGVNGAGSLLMRDGFETGSLVGWSRGQED